MNRRARYLGIVVARLIVQGDVHGARKLAAARLFPGWNVPEARAIAGACAAATKRFGVPATLFCELLDNRGAA